MSRWIVALAALAVGCGGFGTVHTLGKRRVAMQEHAAGPARLVSIVDVDDPVTEADVDASFALSLSGGDWIAGFDGRLVRMSSNAREVRWMRDRVVAWDAVAASANTLIVVGELGDPKALDGTGRAVFAVDSRTGALLWRVKPDVLGPGTAGLVRVGATTIVATSAGEAAFDDRGRMIWQHTARSGDSDAARVAPTVDGVAVITTPRQYAHAFTGGPPLHQALLVRTIDAATGAERGRVELAPDGDYFVMGHLGVTADGRVAIDASDTRQQVAPGASDDGTPTQVHTRISSPRLVHIDLRDPARPVARSTPMPRETPSAMPSRIRPSELLLLDPYAYRGETLSVRVVDVDRGTARSVPLVRTTRTRGYVVIDAVAARPDQLTFAGHYVGDSPPLRARVEDIDCDTDPPFECGDRHGTVKDVAVGAVLGTVRR